MGTTDYFGDDDSDGFFQSLLYNKYPQDLQTDPDDVCLFQSLLETNLNGPPIPSLTYKQTLSLLKWLTLDVKDFYLQLLLS